MKAALKKLSMAALGFSFVGMMGCATAPPSSDARVGLTDDIHNTLTQWDREDPNFRDFRQSADGYVVFPSVGKGGLALGGAFGRGEVYEHGRFVGYADTWQATVGAQIGGQSYAEVIAFETPESLQKFESGQFTVAATASAIALKSGAGASAKYDHGIVIFVKPVGGLMVEAAVGGQDFSFEPSNSNETVSQAQ